MAIDLKNYDPAISALGISITVGGVPSHSAPKGSLHVNTAGTDTTDRMYINIDGSTTWTYLTAGT